jgi:hypothetical protein
MAKTWMTVGKLLKVDEVIDRGPGNTTDKHIITWRLAGDIDFPTAYNAMMMFLQENYAVNNGSFRQFKSKDGHRYIEATFLVPWQ